MEGCRPQEVEAGLLGAATEQLPQEAVIVVVEEAAVRRLDAIPAIK